MRTAPMTPAPARVLSRAPASAPTPDLLDEARSLADSIARLRAALRVQQRQFEAWDRLVAPRTDGEIASDRLSHLRRTGTL